MSQRAVRRRVRVEACATKSALPSPSTSAARTMSMRGWGNGMTLSTTKPAAELEPRRRYHIA